MVAGHPGRCRRRSLEDTGLGGKGGERVGGNEGVPNGFGATRYFMEEQGYDMDPSILYQDNMSAILLEKNGKASSSKRTKHINSCTIFLNIKEK